MRWEFELRSTARRCNINGRRHSRDHEPSSIKVWQIVANEEEFENHRQSVCRSGQSDRRHVSRSGNRATWAPTMTHTAAGRAGSTTAGKLNTTCKTERDSPVPPCPPRPADPAVGSVGVAGCACRASLAALRLSYSTGGESSDDDPAFIRVGVGVEASSSRGGVKGGDCRNAPF